MKNIKNESHNTGPSALYICQHFKGNIIFFQESKDAQWKREITLSKW